MAKAPTQRPAEAPVQHVLDALASPVRREILWRLWDRELAVAAIGEGLGVSGPTLSEHLAVLRRAGLVEVRREGTRRCYRARQDAVRRFRGLLDESAKWASASSHPEQARAAGAIRSAVVVTAEAACSQAAAFRAFTDGARYSRWLGGKVTIRDGRFTAETDIGQTVRGAYLLVAPPALIVMEWDSGVRDVPAPGATQRAHLLIFPTGEGSCRLEVTQFFDSPAQQAYFESAWRFVLGRFVEGAAGEV